MDFDREVFLRARLSRDARFDGKFFIGVLTTRIYCRPICPARASKEENVRYFRTAAAAAEAGFRPCLRCRPECSPGTPAWAGTSNTVSRALRLIGESGLEDGGVEALADHVGIGARHLRRLFLKHLGATPSAVAQTRRLQFAKKLIDETTLPMTQVALAAGFGCVRRFNAAMRNTYHRTPTQIRSLSRHTAPEPENQYLFRLPFRPPFDWNSMLAFLSARATPGVEAVESGVYRRSVSLNGGHGYLEVSLDEQNNSLIVRIELGDPKSLFFTIERIRSMFDLNADWAVIAQTLRKDPALSGRLEAHRGLRVPGSWNGFELATRAILGQQVTVGAATTLAGRLAKAFGQQLSAGESPTFLFPSAERLAEANIAGIGLPKARAETIRSLARAVSDRRIDFERVSDSVEFLNRLREIPGVGNWTAQYIAMRALGEPDAFPFGDLALRRALKIESARELERRAESWRPWRAYATMYFWSTITGSSLPEPSA
jgi:AraC family transcriptional regulator of adaptative response / DNA-3-methyladenine glycosylase II